MLPGKPRQCLRCQHPVQGEAPPPQRPQVTELPLGNPIVPAAPWHRLLGPACGAPPRAAGPLGGPTGGVGPRVQAVVARCTGAYRLSQRPPQDVLAARFGLPMRLGTSAPVEQAPGPAVAAPVAEAQAYGRTQPVAPLDATGGRDGHTRAWWGVAVPTGVPGVAVRLSRGAKDAQELVGERVGGILVPDRWNASRWSPPRWRHVCWAHRLRDVAARRARGGRSQAIGEGLREQARQMLHAWQQVRDGRGTHAQCRGALRPIRRAGTRVRKAGQPCGVAQTAGGCREGLTVYDALGTCGRVEGLEPTHKTAARAIRPGVLWRQGSCGTQRAQGSRCVETMMTVVATLQHQHRPVLTSRTAAGQAASLGRPAPSLLPQQTAAEEDLPIAA